MHVRLLRYYTHVTRISRVIAAVSFAYDVCVGLKGLSVPYTAIDNRRYHPLVLLVAFSNVCMSWKDLSVPSTAIDNRKYPSTCIVGSAQQHEVHGMSEGNP